MLKSSRLLTFFPRSVIKVQSLSGVQRSIKVQTRSRVTLSWTHTDWAEKYVELSKRNLSKVKELCKFRVENQTLKMELGRIRVETLTTGNALSASGVIKMFEKEKLYWLPDIRDKQGNVIRRSRKDSYSELFMRDNEFKEQIFNMFGRGITKEEVGMLGAQLYSTISMYIHQSSSLVWQVTVIKGVYDSDQIKFITAACNTLYLRLPVKEVPGWIEPLEVRTHSGDKAEFRNKCLQLAECLRTNLTEEAERLVAEDKELMTYVDDNGRLPIHWACYGGCLPFVKSAVEANQELITKTDEYGFTPLMTAVSAERLEVVEYLLSCTGSNVNHRNSFGQTALFYACSKNNLPITKILLEKGAQFNSQDKYGNCPLHRASSQGHSDVMKLLLSQREIQVDLADLEGNTSLHMAAEAQNESAALMLIKAGANINCQNKEDETPLDLADTDELKQMMKIAASSL